MAAQAAGVDLPGAVPPGVRAAVAPKAVALALDRQAGEAEARAPGDRSRVPSATCFRLAHRSGHKR